MKNFFLTTAIDYSSDVGHIGNCYEKILADTIARYHRVMGDKTFFLTGTDDHGQKVETEAKKHNLSPVDFSAQITEKNKEQLASLNISFDRFIKTEDQDHKDFAASFFEKSKANGDVYEAEYEGLYCVGCEEVKNKSDLVNDKCPIHPTRELTPVKEKNYFFRFSKYQKFLEDHFANNPQFVVPELRFNEALAFLKRGLSDIPISRATIKWGIPVPNDPEQTIYVWFDALINYLTVGDKESVWPADVHFIGKDINRFHTLLWPAMLKSAGYELPKQVYVHGFLSLDGQRISKSLGNTVYATDLVKIYGTDGVRYFFLRFGPIVGDVDFNLEKIKEVYTADLSNGLGNLVGRVAKLCETSGLDFSESLPTKFSPEIAKNLDIFQVNDALAIIWKTIQDANEKINKEEPWKLSGKQLEESLVWQVRTIRQIAFDLQPFLPETATKIQEMFSNKISATKPLFPRV